MAKNRNVRAAMLASRNTPRLRPDAPLAMNITPGGEMAGWSEDDFISTMRFGVNPAGRALDPEWMPWPSFGQMTDDDLKALWLHLQSVPPQADGG